MLVRVVERRSGEHVGVHGITLVIAAPRTHARKAPSDTDTAHAAAIRGDDNAPKGQLLPLHIGRVAPRRDAAVGVRGGVQAPPPQHHLHGVQVLALDVDAPQALRPGLNKEGLAIRPHGQAANDTPWNYEETGTR